jgi:hypothetical protein
MRIPKLFISGKCEYAPLCKLYQRGGFDCNKTQGANCGRHRHRKQLEATNSYVK